MNDIKVYEVIHSSPQLRTVYDFVVDDDSPAISYEPNAFLLVKNKEGRTNRDVIENDTYTQLERNLYAGKTADKLILKVGTKLAVEVGTINRAGLLTQGIEVVSNNIPAFKASQLALIEADEKYRPIDILKPIDSALSGTAIDQYPDFTVWIWCRALGNDTNGNEGQIINVTPYINKVSTNVGRNGGNFQFSLAPIICEQDENKNWTFKKQSISYYQPNDSQASLQGQGYVAEVNLYSEDSLQNGPNDLRRNQFLFHNILSANDVVWIRFETLQNETQRIENPNNYIIDKSQLPNNVFDLIGLIDTNGVTITSSSASVDINVAGRDLSKIIIEDGTYFYYLEMTQGQLSSAGATNSDQLNSRLIVDNALQYLSIYFNNTIEKVFEFVIQQLATIRVVPDSLFSAYGSSKGPAGQTLKDRRNTRFVSTSDQNSQSTQDKQIAAYETQVLELIKNIRNTNFLTLEKLDAENKVVKQTYDQLKSFMMTIRDHKVRHVVNNQTDGWDAVFFGSEDVRANTFPIFVQRYIYNYRKTAVAEDIKPIVGLIDNILDIENKLNFKNQGSQTLAKGIWQIIKLVIDKGVTNRQIVDSSLSSANGSLINFFRKVCQEPLVEFYSDTYGDMYHFVVRKPPTDRRSILGLLGIENITTEDDSNTPVASVIDISVENVIDEELSMDDNSAYTWYHLIPQQNMFADTTYSLVYLPAIYLPEYADIWGSRPLQIYHNYLPTTSFKNESTNELDVIQQQAIQQQAIEDLKYLIESNAYTPFTRKGWIKINGDRRIKVGNIIRYKPTGEIFTVDHVQQVYSIGENTVERFTLIQMSRGMVEKLIYGVPLRSQVTGEFSFISYFNIVNTKVNYQYLTKAGIVESKIATGERVVNPISNGPVLTPITSSVSSSSIDNPIGNIGIELLSTYGNDERGRFYQLINSINLLGYNVTIKQGKGTYQEQSVLWKVQQSLTDSHGRHETGTAIDINLTSTTGGSILTVNSSNEDWLATGVVAAARQLGFLWGGSDFNNFSNPSHFEYSVGDSVISSNTKTTETVYETTSKSVNKQVLDISKLFSNFKVNKEIFNYFINKQQFSEMYNDSKQVFFEDDNGSVQTQLIGGSVTGKK